MKGCLQTIEPTKDSTEILHIHMIEMNIDSYQIFECGRRLGSIVWTLRQVNL